MLMERTTTCIEPMTPCPTSSARKDTTPASLPNSTPATTKITAQPPLEQLSKMEKIRLRTGEIRERREKKREGSLEDLLGAVHFHLVAWYLETSLLAGAGVETSERALRERIVWRGEKFPVGVSDPPGIHLLVEEVGFLDMLVSRQ